MDHLHPGARARFSCRLDLSLVPRKVNGSAARADAFPSGSWKLVANVSRSRSKKGNPSEVEKMTGAGAGELWYEEWLGLQFRMVLKDNLKKLLH